MSALVEVRRGVHAKGRHSAASTSYAESFAARFYSAQEAIERDRLRKGKAKHRAHRSMLPRPVVAK